VLESGCEREAQQEVADSRCALSLLNSKHRLPSYMSVRPASIAQERYLSLFSIYGASQTLMSEVIYDLISCGLMTTEEAKS
jgi:hypothetical protein